VIFEQVPTGGDRNFSYLVGDEEAREAMVVDPSDQPGALIARAGELGLRITLIVNTHLHQDHVAGNDEVRRASGARVACFTAAGGADHVLRDGDIELADGDRVAVGKTKFQVLHTPGHTPDHICLYGAGRVITGDTLFVGKVGGTDLAEGARREYNSLHARLMTLPDETEVWPGHDVGVRPFSTIGAEKRENPFLLCRSFEEFVELKRNWAEYKRTHGIA
jgi:glyoxylase-like metal-dependent hydrolase (beta-lactamase superfamily II)